MGGKDDAMTIISTAPKNDSNDSSGLSIYGLVQCCLEVCVDAPRGVAYLYQSRRGEPEILIYLFIYALLSGSFIRNNIHQTILGEPQINH